MEFQPIPSHISAISSRLCLPHGFCIIQGLEGIPNLLKITFVKVRRIFDIFQPSQLLLQHVISNSFTIPGSKVTCLPVGLEILISTGGLRSLNKFMHTFHQAFSIPYQTTHRYYSLYCFPNLPSPLVFFSCHWLLLFSSTRNFYHTFTFTPIQTRNPDRLLNHLFYLPDGKIILTGSFLVHRSFAFPNLKTLRIS